MCELEPAFLTVPNPLVVTLMLETLSKGVEYLEENNVGEMTDCCVRRHLTLVIIVGTLSFEKFGQDSWSEWRIVIRTSYCRYCRHGNVAVMTVPS